MGPRGSGLGRPEVPAMPSRAAGPNSSRLRAPVLHRLVIEFISLRVQRGPITPDTENEISEHSP